MSSPLRVRPSKLAQRLPAGPSSPSRRPRGQPHVASAAAASPTLAAPTTTTQLPPELLRQWDVSGNKLLRPSQVAATSGRMVNWRCDGCNAEFRKRVRDHVADAGACPSCGKKPLSLLSGGGGAPAQQQQQHRSPPRRPSPGAEQRRLLSLEPQHRDGRLLNPMLAHTWEKYRDRLRPRDDLFLSKKLDGVRCIAAWDPVAKRPFFVSRVGNTFESCDWIGESLRPAFEVDPSLVLDGEIYDHSVPDFSELIGSIKVQRQHRAEAHELMQQRLQFHAFDVLYSSGMAGGETPFATRLSVLERILNRVPVSANHKSLAGARRVQLVENDIIRARDVDAHLEGALKNGFEGLMARTATGTYTFGKRSTSLLKVKRMQDAEFEVVGVVEGKGRLKGMVGAIECVAPNGTQTKASMASSKTAAPDDVRTFRAAFGVADELRKEFWRKREELLLGKHVTVRYQELTPSGVPRFGQFKCVRSDADGSGFV
jgi:DNA ligase-1